MTERHCGTCRFFAPAPLAGTGQCRCPSFAPPPDQDLVAAHDLACRRLGGDSWHPREEMAAASPGETASAADAPTADLPIVPPRAGRGRVRSRWRDRVRPTWPGRLLVAGLALLLVVTLVPTLGNALGAHGDDAAPVVPTVVSSPTVAALTPTTTTAAQPSPTLPIIAEPSVTEPSAGVAPPTPAPTPASERDSEAAGRPAVAGLRIGGRAMVATGDATVPLRLRRTPDVAAPIVGRIPDGQALTLLDGPRAGGGQTWWRVRHAGVTGWVAGAFLRPAP